MIIKQQISGFIQQVTPRKRFDETARRYTDEVELGRDGLPRYTVLLAVPGEREPLRVTASEALLGREPEALVGQIVALTYAAKVEFKWASAEGIQTMGGEGQ